MLRYLRICLFNIRRFAARAINKTVFFFSSPTLPWIEEQKNMVFSRATGGITFPIANNLRWPLRKGYQCLRLGIKKTRVETNNLGITVGRCSSQGAYKMNLLNIASIDLDKNSDYYSFILSAAARELGCAINTGNLGLTSGLLRGGAEVILQIREKDYAGYDNIEDALMDEIFLKTLSRSYVKMIEIEIPSEHLWKENKISSSSRLAYFLEKLRMTIGEKPIGILLTSPDKKQLSAIFENLWLREIKVDFMTIEQQSCNISNVDLKNLTETEDSFLRSLTEAQQTIRFFGLETKIIASGKFVSEFDILRALALGADSCVTLTPFEWLLTGKLNAPVGSVAYAKSLVENFHRHTLKATAKLMGECGFSGTKDISAERFLQKTGNKSVKTLQNVYQF